MIENRTRLWNEEFLHKQPLMPNGMKSDPKIKVLFTCYDALKTLDDDAAHWVISQLDGRFNAEKTTSVRPETQTLHQRMARATDDDSNMPEATDDGLAEALSKANPPTEDKRVLFVAWFLFGRGDVRDFKSLQVSKRLDDIGHGVNSPTVCFNRLKALKPAMIIQTRKSGKTKQARKTYRITPEGIKTAHAMLPPPIEQ